MEALVINTNMMEFDFSCYYSNSTTTTTTTTPTTTTTTTPTTSETCCTWNDWSPVVDWDQLSTGNDDFHVLLDSMIDVDEGVVVIPTSEGCSSIAASPENTMIDVEEDVHVDLVEDTKGLRLVHLLMAAAEALGGANKSRELARVILVRLKELVSPNEGTNMERLAAYFREALQGLLDGGTLHINKHWSLSSSSNNNGTQFKDDILQSDLLAAFQLLQDMSPYVKFGHFTANQAILEAVVHERRVHIVDYDIMEGIQWPSLMQALVSRKDGLPIPHLRITALSRGTGGGGGRRSFGTMQETGRRLTAFAASIGQPFSFHQCRLDSDETFRPSGLKLVRGEALIINCMLHLPHFIYRSRESTVSFLTGAKTLNPKLITLVEEEVGPSSDNGFIGKFMDSLHRYSAMYDSLEAGFPMQSRARALVERVFIGPKITGSIARVYRAIPEDQEGSSWAEWLAEIGFQPTTISFANHCQAKLLLGLFNDGYGVEELATNKIVLGWKSRRLLSASIWTSSDND